MTESNPSALHRGPTSAPTHFAVGDTFSYGARVYHCVGFLHASGTRRELGPGIVAVLLTIDNGDPGYLAVGGLYQVEEKRFLPAMNGDEFMCEQWPTLGDLVLFHEATLAVAKLQLRDAGEYDRIPDGVEPYQYRAYDRDVDGQLDLVVYPHKALPEDGRHATGSDR